MASSTPATADTMVTLKVNFQGVTRRAKMPLRQMIPSVLDSQIRTFLHIPAGLETIIERYSDSAAMYVVLDPNDMGVYKQLYRAAKAKSKLKLRVTIKNDKPAPKPVTVEDESDAAASTVENSTEAKSEKPKQQNMFDVAATAPAMASNGTHSANSAVPKAAGTPARVSATFPEHLASNPGLRCQLSGNAVRAMRRQAGTGTPPQPLNRCNPTFAICCNHCEKTIPDVHYHCSTCDDGDFDLCQACVDKGTICYDSDHWLIKRTVRSGQIVNSTTETLAPKPKPKKEQSKQELPPPAREPALTSQKPAAVPELLTAKLPTVSPLPFRSKPLYANARTCNCCVEERAEHEFLHCNNCEDYDLCRSCFQKDGHGHHPKHSFSPAVAGTPMPDHIAIKLAAGRNQMHNAICDGCDKYINGVRHKCLDCPDWDYCNDCIQHAGFVHAKHRFVPVYESLSDMSEAPIAHIVHNGICCDGPLCSAGKGYPSYIRGIRYKCAICHDLDFCANCEANPANDHNKTHPLIKFKTPVRNVSVTTSGEHHDGKRMPAMGDRTPEGVPAPAANSLNTVQTLVDVKPVEAIVKDEPKQEPKEEHEVKREPEPSPAPPKLFDEQDLRADFVRDSVVDGTILPPNHVFEQTWTLRNEGEVAWPPGCSVKFVGGDYMGNLDSAHPAKTSELMLASESSVCETAVASGQEHSFTVPLRTPARAGKIISYWRLTTQNGYRFGHRLWCDVSVRAVKTEAVAKTASPVVKAKEEEPAKASTMIFPKLEKESPVSSMHEEAKPSPAEEKSAESDGFEDCAEDDEWDASDDGFLTDEEYDILDASDEEFLEEQQKKVHQ